MMTALKTALVLLLVSAPSFAAGINCEIDSMDRSEHSNYQALLVDVVKGSCEGGAYKIEISGIGLGLRIAGETGLGFTCPFSDEIVGTYGGLKVDATALIIGLDAGLFVGSHGICALGGINSIGLGAGIDGVRLKITRNTQARNVAGKTENKDAVALLEENSPKHAPAANEAAPGRASTSDASQKRVL
jgi:hypothetical protein